MPEICNMNVWDLYKNMERYVKIENFTNPDQKTLKNIYDEYRKGFPELFTDDKKGTLNIFSNIVDDRYQHDPMSVMSELTFKDDSVNTISYECPLSKIFLKQNFPALYNWIKSERYKKEKAIFLIAGTKESLFRKEIVYNILKQYDVKDDMYLILSMDNLNDKFPLESSVRETLKAKLTRVFPEDYLRVCCENLQDWSLYFLKKWDKETDPIDPNKPADDSSSSNISIPGWFVRRGICSYIWNNEISPDRLKNDSRDRILVSLMNVYKFLFDIDQFKMKEEYDQSLKYRYYCIFKYFISYARLNEFLGSVQGNKRIINNLDAFFHEIILDMIDNPSLKISYHRR